MSCDASNTFRELKSTAPTTCDCKIGYYEIAGSEICGVCDPTCLGCSGPGPNKCISCDNSIQHRILDPTTNNSCICSVGFFEDGPPECSACHYSCFDCDDYGENNCTQCPSILTNRLNNISSSGSCPCKNGYFDLGTLNCSLCHYSCLTCTSGNLLNYMTKCKDCPLNSNRV